MPQKVVRLRLASKYYLAVSVIQDSSSKQHNPASTNEDSLSPEQDNKSTYTPFRPEARSKKEYAYLPEEWPEKKGYHKWIKKYLTRIETRKHKLSLKEMMIRTATVETQAEDEDRLRDTLPIIQKDLIITTSDGSPLLVFLKDGLLEPWQAELKTQIRPRLEMAVQNLLRNYKPPKPSDSRELKSRPQAEREHLGRYYFGVWKARGQKDVVLTNDTRAAGYKSHATTVLYRTLAPIAQTIGILFEAIDKPLYDRYRANFQRLQQTTDLHGYHFTQRDCFPTLALLINYTVAPHHDRRDVKDGYVADLVAGEFTGGELVVPELKVQIALQPGDVLFMRSRLLEHFLAPFDGERYAFVYFHHQVLFEEAGVEDGDKKQSRRESQNGSEEGSRQKNRKGPGEEPLDEPLEESIENVGGMETRGRKRRRIGG